MLPALSGVGTSIHVNYARPHIIAAPITTEDARIKLKRLYLNIKAERVLASQPTSPVHNALPRIGHLPGQGPLIYRTATPEPFS